CFTQLGQVLAIRSERISLFSLGLRTNMPLLGAVALTFALQLAIVYVPALRIVFKTVPLSAADLAVCIACAAVILGVAEAEKFLRRLRARGPGPGMREAVGRAVMWSDAKLPRGFRSLLGLL